MIQIVLIGLFLSLALADTKIYLVEEFSTDSYTNNWIESTYKGGDQGKFIWSAGKFFNDAVKDKGIQTSQDARFYGISRKLEESFSNQGKKLVIQFQVKHEQTIDCGGGYIKVLGSDLDQKSFHGEMPYKIMFGPDICGIGTKKVHVIFNYNNKNLLTKKEIRCKDDEFTHLYTLIVNPDNTYEVLIDNEKAESGLLEEDWDFLEPMKIKDPNSKKPEDWEDNEKIDDPNDVKPDNWEVAKTVADPKAKKPEDWDDEMDGEWEAPQIDNPDYKGDWKPKQIDNPKYKGPWIHPEIDNPDYKADPNIYLQTDIGSVGFDLWQVKSGTIFDNVLLTDDPDYARKYAEETWKVTADGEKKMKNKQDEELRKESEEADKKRKEEEEKKKAEEKLNMENVKADEQEKEETKESEKHIEL